MRKFITLVVALVLGVTAVQAQDYKIQGKTITATKAERSKAEPQDTGYTLEEGGKTYHVYVGASGSCYIVKVSKNGNEYKKYLSAEISREICKAINHEYKEKKA